MSNSQQNSKGIDPKLIEEKAFEIYSRTPMASGLSEEQVVVQCYKKAKAFLETCEKIGAGKVSIADPDTARKTISVPRVRAKNDGAGFEDVINEQTKEVVMEDAPVDPYAFGVNLPLDHPINQRCIPNDGISLKNRIAKCRQSLVAR